MQSQWCDCHRPASAEQMQCRLRGAFCRQPRFPGPDRQLRAISALPLRHQAHQRAGRAGCRMARWGEEAGCAILGGWVYPTAALESCGWSDFLRLPLLSAMRETLPPRSELAAGSRPSASGAGLQPVLRRARERPKLKALEIWAKCARCFSVTSRGATGGNKLLHHVSDQFRPRCRDSRVIAVVCITASALHAQLTPASEMTARALSRAGTTSARAMRSELS